MALMENELILLCQISLGAKLGDISKTIDLFAL